MRPLSFIYLVPAGAFVAALVAVVLVGPIAGGPRGTGSEVVRDAGFTRFAVTNVGENAFGSLASTSSAGSPLSATPQGRGMGGGGSATPAMAPLAEADASKMIAPGEPYPAPTNYVFRYDGGPIGNLAERVGIYRRVKGIAGTGSVANALKAVTGGLADFSRLQNAVLGSFSIVEDREFGYIAFVDAVEGIVSMNQNWQRWPHPENLCRDEACYQQYRLSLADIPADDAVVAMANAFLDQYGISREGYGAPVVNSQWRVQIATVPAQDMYVPEILTVTYPLLVEGAQAVDDGGMASGLQVNVNVRHGRADSMWGLASMQYQRSDYAGETDEKRILDVASRGGVWGGWFDESAKTVEIRLGEPEMVLRRTWMPAANGASEEVLVPSLRFPVIDPPQEMAWRTHVVVPLAKEILDQMNVDGGGVPMPLAR